MSILTYQPPGGPTLTFGPAGWLTLNFDMEPWYDPSETDCLGTRIHISGSFLINPKTNPIKGLGGSGPGDKVPDLRMAQKGWSSARGTLKFTNNGVNLIPQYSLTDAKSGPLPGPMRITEITESTFLANLSITAHFAENSPNAEGGVVLSHRWRESVTIDRHFMSRKMRVGKIIASSNSFNSSKATLDLARDQFMTTNLDQGFVRESQEYAIEESGIAANYTISDREQFRMMPDGSTQSDGEMQVTSQRMGQPGRYQTCWVRLLGPKQEKFNPAKLIALATAICYQKLRLNGGFFPTKADFKEKLWENDVFVSLTGMAKPSGKVQIGKGDLQQQFMSIESCLKGFGTAVPLQVGKNYISGTASARGSAGVLLHGAAYQNPTKSQTLGGNNQLVINGATSPEGVVPGG